MTEPRLRVRRSIHIPTMCLKSLRGFDEAAEAEDERGRRRLWVEYRRGGTASEGRGRHHVIGGYADGGAGEDGRPKWRSVSLLVLGTNIAVLLDLSLIHI